MAVRRDRCLCRDATLAGSDAVLLKVELVAQRNALNHRVEFLFDVRAWMRAEERILNSIDSASFRRDEKPGLRLPDRELVRRVGNGHLNGRRLLTRGKDIDAIGIAGLDDNDVAYIVDEETLRLVERHSENFALCGTGRELLDAARTVAGAVGDIQVALLVEIHPVGLDPRGLEHLICAGASRPIFDHRSALRVTWLRCGVSPGVTHENITATVDDWIERPGKIL